jgi:transposase-like protein
MKDLKTVYTAPDEQSAELALEMFDEKWSQKYLKIAVSWRRHWPQLSTFFKYPENSDLHHKLN